MLNISLIEKIKYESLFTILVSIFFCSWAVVNTITNKQFDIGIICYALTLVTGEIFIYLLIDRYIFDMINIVFLLLYNILIFCLIDIIFYLYCNRIIWIFSNYKFSIS